MLDLYLPDGDTNAPTAVFIHGGRWFRGDKEQIELYDRIESLTKAGIGIASINYTYSSKAIWPAQIDDVMSSLRFIADNGGRYGYDGGRLAVWGQSSGAHLALWTGLKAATDPTVDVEAVVSWYALSELYNIAPDRVADTVPGENERFPEPSPESLLIGMPVPDNKADADAASPSEYVKTIASGTELPAFMLAHGTADFVISPLQSQRMYDNLKAQGGASELILRYVDGAGHGGSLFDDETPYAVTFLAEQLDATSVPVPATLPLLLAGFGWLALMKRRKDTA